MGPKKSENSPKHRDKQNAYRAFDPQQRRQGLQELPVNQPISRKHRLIAPRLQPQGGDSSSTTPKTVITETKFLEMRIGTVLSPIEEMPSNVQSPVPQQPTTSFARSPQQPIIPAISHHSALECPLLQQLLMENEDDTPRTTASTSLSAVRHQSAHEFPILQKMISKTDKPSRTTASTSRSAVRHQSAHEFPILQKMIMETDKPTRTTASTSKSAIRHQSAHELPILTKIITEIDKPARTTASTSRSAVRHQTAHEFPIIRQMLEETKEPARKVTSTSRTIAGSTSGTRIRPYGIHSTAIPGPAPGPPGSSLRLVPNIVASRHSIRSATSNRVTVKPLRVTSIVAGSKNPSQGPLSSRAAQTSFRPILPAIKATETSLRRGGSSKNVSQVKPSLPDNPVVPVSTVQQLSTKGVNQIVSLSKQRQVSVTLDQPSTSKKMPSHENKLTKKVNISFGKPEVEPKHNQLSNIDPRNSLKVTYFTTHRNISKEKAVTEECDLNQPCSSQQAINSSRNQAFRNSGRSDFLRDKMTREELSHPQFLSKNTTEYKSGARQRSIVDTIDQWSDVVYTSNAQQTKRVKLVTLKDTAPITANIPIVQDDIEETTNVTRNYLSEECAQSIPGDNLKESTGEKQLSLKPNSPVKSLFGDENCDQDTRFLESQFLDFDENLIRSSQPLEIEMQSMQDISFPEIPMAHLDVINSSTTICDTNKPCITSVPELQRSGKDPLICSTPLHDPFSPSAPDVDISLENVSLPNISLNTLGEVLNEDGLQREPLEPYVYRAETIQHCVDNVIDNTYDPQELDKNNPGLMPQVNQQIDVMLPDLMDIRNMDETNPDLIEDTLNAFMQGTYDNLLDDETEFQDFPLENNNQRSQYGNKNITNTYKNLIKLHKQRYLQQYPLLFRKSSNAHKMNKKLFNSSNKSLPSNLGTYLEQLPINVCTRRDFLDLASVKGGLFLQSKSNNNVSVINKVNQWSNVERPSTDKAAGPLIDEMIKPELLNHEKTEEVEKESPEHNFVKNEEEDAGFKDIHKVGTVASGESTEPLHPTYLYGLSKTMPNAPKYKAKSNYSAIVNSLILLNAIQFFHDNELDEVESTVYELLSTLYKSMKQIRLGHFADPIIDQLINLVGDLEPSVLGPGEADPATFINCILQTLVQNSDILRRRIESTVRITLTLYKRCRKLRCDKEGTYEPLYTLMLPLLPDPRFVHNKLGDVIEHSMKQHVVQLTCRKCLEEHFHDRSIRFVRVGDTIILSIYMDVSTLFLPPHARFGDQTRRLRVIIVDHGPNEPGDRYSAIYVTVDRLTTYVHYKDGYRYIRSEVDTRNIYQKKSVVVLYVNESRIGPKI